MIAKKVIIEDRILDTEVDKDRLLTLLVDVMVEDTIKEIRGGLKATGVELRPSRCSAPIYIKKDADI